MRFFQTHMRTRIFAAALGCAAAFGFFALAHPALAQDAASQLAEVAEGGGLPTTSVFVIIARIIRVLLGTLGIVFTVVVLYAGFIYLSAQGNPDKIKVANKMLKNGIIGMILCMLSFSITQFVLSRLLGAAGLNGGIASIADQYGEPLSGSLGAGIVEAHYPERNAIDVPRNTRIMVTFKEPIDPSTVIAGFDQNEASTGLNTDGVNIYPTASGESASLATDEVLVHVSEDRMTFSFDPVPLLGSSVSDVNYSVFLSPSILKDNGTAAFTGNYGDGYLWTFEVSTEADLTPPQVVSVMPSRSPEARNTTIAITFNEAMDAVSSQGTYDGADGTFLNIEVTEDGGAGARVPGTFAIGNGYRTVEFTPFDACGEDPCGDTIYCLPASANLSVRARAATLASEPPQAQPFGMTFDGLVDASANSLDGDGDDAAEGPGTDDYAWAFSTDASVNDDVPVITDIRPGVNGEFADQDADVEIDFSVPMRASTLSSSNVSLWPDPWYEFWFSVGKVDTIGTDGEALSTSAYISHPTLVSPESLGWTYYPVVTEGVKSAYQICMYPAEGPNESGTGSCNVTESLPFCCNGVPSGTACVTGSGSTLPDSQD